jgi:hypothetical protein
MNSNCKTASEIYETPSVACCVVFVEKGYSSSKRGDLEDLGGSKEEGYW